MPGTGTKFVTRTAAGRTDMDISATSAFTPVKARRTLVQQEPSRTAPPNTQTKKVAWPAPVREYVQRSFAPEARIDGIGIPEMELKLKATITEAAENDRMNIIEWANLPLPQQLIQQERAIASWTAHGPPESQWDHPNSADLGPSKKRKLQNDDVIMGNDVPLPPWRSGGNANPLIERGTHANQNQMSKAEKRAKKAQAQEDALRKQQDALGKGSSKYQAQIDKRRQRFGLNQISSPPWGYARDPSPINSESIGSVVGTCQKLEKNYFRLVNTPKPEEIRPLEVLRKTLVLLKKKWKADGNYLYICDQFKSMRQDLTVQHIKNSFTIEVYELHARIALEWKDLGEYNQCQTQLRALYSLNLGGNPAEFLAYRILYFILTCNRTGLNDVLAELTPELKQQLPLQHALTMRSALAAGNYHKFFRLYLEVPNMGAYLVDQFVARERLAALSNICRAYIPNVSIKFLTEELGFESYQEALEFLEKQLTSTSGEDAIDHDNFMLETRKAAAIFEAAKSKAFATVDIKGQI